MHKQVVVITGAARGIGLALAQICIQQKMHVVMADNAVEPLTEQVEKLNSLGQGMALGISCDVTDQNDIKQLLLYTISNFKRVNLLINNAGISGFLSPVWALTTEQINKVFAVNIHGVINCLREFLPFMFTQQHRSKIINMASVYGLCSGSQIADYAMSKHAIVALSESLYFDLQRLGKPVDVAVVCPSFVNTKFINNTALADNKLQKLLSNVTEYSASPIEVASYIIQEAKKNKFYIFPDKQVKEYASLRMQEIMHETAPHKHKLEKIMLNLCMEQL